MKYGIYFAYWVKEWQADYKYYIEKVKKLGFDVLEVSCAAFKNYYTDKSQLIDIRKCAEDNGITLTAGYGPTKSENISSADPDVVRNAMKFYEETLPKLELMNIKWVGGGLYSYWPVDFNIPFDKKADFDRAAMNMKQVAKIAEDCGVTLGMEVLNRFEGYLLNTAEEAVKFVDAVDRPNVKVMLDTFHMGIEENDPGDAIRTAGSKLGHLHLGEQNRRVPGQGNMDWEKIGQALRDINFQGAAVMEPFVMQGGTIGSEIKVWRDIIPNPTEEKLDADAKASVEFVRRTFRL